MLSRSQLDAFDTPVVDGRAGERFFAVDDVAVYEHRVIRRDGRIIVASVLAFPGKRRDVCGIVRENLGQLGAFLDNPAPALRNKCRCMVWMIGT